MRSLHPDRTRALLCWATCLLAQTALATTLTAGDLALELDDSGRVTGLTAEGYPLAVDGDGGWQLADLGAGSDRIFDFPFDVAWPEDNEWLKQGGMWRFGAGWEPVDETYQGSPVRSLALTRRTHSDAVRLTFPAAGESAVTVTVHARFRDFSGRPRFGIVAVDAAGSATSRWIPFEWSTAETDDAAWRPLRCVISAPPNTALWEVYLAVEDALGTVSLGGASITLHAGAARAQVSGSLLPANGPDQLSTVGEALDCRVTTRYEASDLGLRLRARVEELSGRRRAIALRYKLPIDGVGWEWWDDLDRMQTIPESGRRLFSNWRLASGGHLFSPYPLACLVRPAPAAAVMLAAPADQPVLARYGYRHGDGLFVVFELGFAADLGHQACELELLLAAPEARWGLRGALQHFYELDPPSQPGTRRPAGAWFTALNPEAVLQPDRFGLLYDEQAAAHPAWTQRHGLLAATLWQPWGAWLGETPYPTAGGLHPVGAVIEEPPAAERLMADADNQPVSLRCDDGATFMPWCTAPGLNHGAAPGPALLAELDRLIAATKPRFDGVILDGLGARWAGWAIDDYRDAHLAASRTPLGHSRVTRRPTRFAAAGHWELLTAVSRRLRAADRLVIGSIDDDAPLPFLVGALDVVGGGERVPTVEHLQWLRAMARHKPVTFLDSTILDPTAKRSEQREIWHRALLYGAFPGASGWLNRRTIELNSVFFDVYVPILRELAAAGWEPVPHAWLNDASIELERYGSGDALHLVISNDSDLARLVTLTLEPGPLDLAPVDEAGKLRPRRLFVDRLSLAKRAIEFRPAFGRWQTTVAIGPRAVQVLTPYKIDLPLDLDEGLGLPLPLLQ